MNDFPEVEISLREMTMEGKEFGGKRVFVEQSRWHNLGGIMIVSLEESGTVFFFYVAWEVSTCFRRMLRRFFLQQTDSWVSAKGGGHALGRDGVLWSCGFGFFVLFCFVGRSVSLGGIILGIDCFKKRTQKITLGPWLWSFFSFLRNFFYFFFFFSFIFVGLGD
ncbi:hypothetical protein DFH27DRAFT_17366 [Peziza echinospora]|nr:hypothetical protein DFH27DRAFT_17366 [Peziza echinospora]